VIDFASLLWFAAYGVAFLSIGLVLRLVARWSGGTSLADPFGGGYRDAPWPRGVQEEEPVRWDVQRLRRPGRASSREEVPGTARTAGIGSRLDRVCR
jgi:hypothetical protein